MQEFVPSNKTARTVGRGVKQRLGSIKVLTSDWDIYLSVDLNYTEKMIVCPARLTVIAQVAGCFKITCGGSAREGFGESLLTPAPHSPTINRSPLVNITSASVRLLILIWGLFYFHANEAWLKFVEIWVQILHLGSTIVYMLLPCLFADESISEVNAMVSTLCKLKCRTKEFEFVHAAPQPDNCTRAWSLAEIFLGL
ncbi:hypothetical protein EVAR_44651_1 [Eumeta japonica]|uniref:Uncharacterized protein n=1 Tax=Eumeta variegata TaxID=151549 RepID=A0A4C1XGD6_EUMVA|nr:hypothetical protein EVAR_44651_1 [Eumeta japonica]